MKVKTSITLSKDIVEKIDSLSESYGNRSTLIEKAVRDLIAAREKLDRDQSDLEIINKQADTLNSEAIDVLSYQVDL
ncbi:putative transcriptional regulator, CopG family [Desulfonatronospira thiodismutans ASO3-1]|uniref:Transcriptional regulator, CopG family n=1 Tax=Desulfonatronospira thiodismutans ASO3-1 TaxID=555779 RepID=D6SRT6_9BACT|nr:ribbon-helix-helix domain-containing protein [Desulfonatronospira thiodismutans]EFI33402.1 putative transcriptional regulator, CopG family [Desulfonatronospira thiodismutans ASO3-1]